MSMGDESDDSSDDPPVGILDIPPASPMDELGEQDDSTPGGLLDIPTEPEPPADLPPLAALEDPVDEPAPIDDADPADLSPGRDAEELVQGLIDAINSGNADVIRKFVSDEYSEAALNDGGVDLRVDVYMSVHEEGGECRMVSVDTTPDGDLVVLVQSRLSLNRQRMEIVRDQKPPHKILLVNIDEV
jgi:hypothetical protein